MYLVYLVLVALLSLVGPRDDTYCGSIVDKNDMMAYWEWRNGGGAGSFGDWDLICQ